MARRFLLGAFLAAVAAPALGAEISGGCARGSTALQDDGAAGDAMLSSSSGVSSSEAGIDGSGSSTGSSSGSSSGDAGSGDDAGDGGESDDGDDSASSNDSGGDADARDDAGPSVIFGATCPTGTTYVEPFTSDPVVGGTFALLAGAYTYSSTSDTLSLSADGANTQLWIGARPSWTNYTLSVPVRLDTSGGNGGVTFRMESTPASPANNAGQMYYAGIATNQVMLGEENGNWTELDGPAGTFTTGTFYTLEITADGTSLSVSVGGTSYVTNYSDAAFTFGSFGLRSYSAGMTYGTIIVTCN